MIRRPPSSTLSPTPPLSLPPLDGDRPPILQAGIPHIARPAAREPRQLARHPLGVGVALAHPQQQVLTGAGGREAEILLDHEVRSEEHTSELQSQSNLVCRLL